MAQVSGSQVKLNNGQLITPQQGGWYDGQQFWGGTLSQPGQINSLSNQPGAGQAVSNEVIAQTNPANVAYIAQQRQKAGIAPAPTTGVPQSNQPTQTAQPSSTGAAGTGTPMLTPQPTINLPDLYQNLYKDSGVSDLEKKFSDMTTSYNEAQSKINDNPFLSEASRVGRIQKLTLDYQNATAGVRSDIATKKADVEMQLNLATKQYDINTQAAKDALSQFNTLLGSGALDNASGEDIANLTRATGLSSTMIQGAITANKAKNIKTSTISYDDGTNQGFVVINSDTGEIINKQVISASKPKATSVGDQKLADEQQTQQNLIDDIQRGAILRDLINHYGVSGGLSLEDIYRLYNSYSPYGQAGESLEQVKLGKFKA